MIKDGVVLGENFLILGDGFIGNYIYEVFEKIGLKPVIYKEKIHTEEDITDILSNYPRYIIINCAGKTGRPNIDWCEEHKTETAFANITLPLMISNICKRIHQYWVHIGSGCIYTGYDKHWTEEDTPNFFGSFYSMTKMFSQEALKEDPNCLVLRIRMPIAGSIHPRSYITKLVGYAKRGFPIIYSQNSVTVLEDLIPTIIDLVSIRATGTFNIVNEGSIDPCEILEIYKEKKDNSLIWVKMSYAEVRNLTMKADRSNCILSTRKLKNHEIIMPDIKERIYSVL